MNPSSPRLVYLDQFRGYTVAGMVAVNYLGHYTAVVHPVLRHHNTYCSYADTIMPQFFLAVGFALRYTLLKRLATEGWRAAHWRVIRRVFALLILAALVHGFDRVNVSWDALWEQGLWSWLVRACERTYFQTLTHIAVTTLWVLPVIAARWPIRFLWMIGSAALHLWLSHQFWLKVAWERPVIDGGPLGFLTWSIPVLVGTFAADWLTGANPPGGKIKLVISGTVLMLLGYGLSCLTLTTAQESQGLVRYAPPPFTAPLASAADQKGKSSVDLWTMSQRTGSVSYQTFAAGFSLIVLFLCCVIFDQHRQIGLFRTLGSNALVAYIVQGLAIDSAHHLLPASAPLWAVFVGSLAVLAITWMVCRYLEARGWYLRL